MSSPLLTLRHVNGEVRRALQRFRPELRHCSGIAPGEFSALRAELSCARQCLHEAKSPMEAPEDVTAFAREVSEYRANLEKLKHILPDVQMRLLVETARLRKVQLHLAAADAWAGASKKALYKKTPLK